MKKLFMGIAVLLFVSCSNTGETEAVNPNQDVIDFLAADGFDVSAAVVKGEQIIVEGDIAFDIEDLRLRMDSRDKQWRTRYIISRSRVNNIRVRFSGNLSNAWRNSMRGAFRALNNVNNTRLYVREVTGSRDIFVKRDRSVGSAYGTFPSSSGRAGHTIVIGRIEPTGYYAGTALHEMGHNIGFRHDHAPREGGSYSRVPGSPYSDSRSIMSYNRSRYFTYWDKRSIQILYPR